ncbi:hypothetical protein C8A05DRAFT_39511 [Staphylotrichum tortipilum]|uniref:Uncharacterized protein n=1 Tax=Staphylotrichum tortipilum TaxID=2831512 RepID=A0AAN6M9L4_9PEZI|nr:hypothetical protein C8A05DRAFT_39511 [Staphylotrichum longicolle]
MSFWPPFEGGDPSSNEDGRVFATWSNHQGNVARSGAGPGTGMLPDSQIDPRLLALASPTAAPAPASAPTPGANTSLASPPPSAAVFGSIPSPAATGRSSSLLAGEQQHPPYGGYYGQQQQDQQHYQWYLARQQQQEQQEQQYQDREQDLQQASDHPYQQEYARQLEMQVQQEEEDFGHHGGHYGGRSSGQVTMGGRERPQYLSPAAPWSSGSGPDRSWPSPASVQGWTSAHRPSAVFSPSRLSSADAPSPAGSLPQPYAHSPSIRPSAPVAKSASVALPSFADGFPSPAAAPGPQAIAVYPGFVPARPPHAHLSLPGMAAASTPVPRAAPQGDAAPMGGPPNGHQAQGGLVLPPLVALAPATAAPPAAVAQAPDWQRLYNRADWTTYKRFNTAASAANRANGRTRDDALALLVKDIAKSLNPQSTSQEVLASRAEMQRTSVAWAPNEPIILYLASRGIHLAKSTWPQNQPLPFHGKYSATLGFRWETNIRL